jgi:peptidoglycan/xylan/chitin deacetylase (PgdA/CDA1 family)
VVKVLQDGSNRGHSATLDRAVFVISVDTELAWNSLHYPSIPPETVSTERAGAERRIVEGLLQLFAKHDIKATWAVVGHLFLGECRREGGVVHPEIVRPGYRWLDRDWFDPDPGADLATEPMWYGTDIVDMIKNATPTQEIGSHSFSHLIVGDPDCSEEAFRSDLVACREVARETGVELRSFVYPRNTIGHLDVLPEQGFRAYRGLRPAAFADRGNGVRRLMRALDKVTPLEGSNVLPEPVGALWNIPATNLFAPFDRARYMPLSVWGWQQSRRLRHAARNRGLFHLWFHPHNLLDEPETALGTLEKILVTANELRGHGQLDNLTMTDLSDRLESSEPEQTAASR